MPLSEELKEVLRQMESRQYYQVYCRICHKHISSQYSNPLSRNDLRRIKKDHAKEKHRELLSRHSRL